MRYSPPESHSMVVYSNWRMSQSIIETVLMTENIRNVAVIEIIFGGIKGWQNLAVSSMMCLLFLLGNTIIPVDHVFSKLPTRWTVVGGCGWGWDTNADRHLLQIFFVSNARLFVISGFTYFSFQTIEMGSWSPMTSIFVIFCNGVDTSNQVFVASTLSYTFVSFARGAPCQVICLIRPHHKW